MTLDSARAFPLSAETSDILTFVLALQRELIEQDTPMIGFQRGTDFNELFGSGQTFENPDTGKPCPHRG